mmetsp:Transcript_42088/g.51050  ORF Transcript_42088/g.51050 Transcript_42088/m.51050 type:complete len:316 (+) Transcript_42088:2-949(+)
MSAASREPEGMQKGRDISFPAELPNEVILSLIPLLLPSDLANLCAVSHEWRETLQDDRIWHALYVHRWGPPGNDDDEFCGDDNDNDNDTIMQDCRSANHPELEVGFRGLFIQRWTEIRRIVCNVEGIVKAASQEETPAWGTTKLLDFHTVWVPIMKVFTTTTCHCADVAEFLLKSRNPVVNLAGVYWYIIKCIANEFQVGQWAEEWGGDDDNVRDEIQNMFEKVQMFMKLMGCADRRMSLRWWTLGRLGHGFSWRGQDEVHLLSGTLEELVMNDNLWRILSTGTQNEIRRIALVDESLSTSSVFSAWLSAPSVLP